MTTPRHSRPLFATIFIAACAVSTGASTHIGTDFHDHSGFLAGFGHPVGGLALGWVPRVAGAGVAALGVGLLAPLV